MPSRNRASICECTSGPGTSRSSALPRYDSKPKLSSSPVSDCRPSWDEGSPGRRPTLQCHTNMPSGGSRSQVQAEARAVQFAIWRLQAQLRWGPALSSRPSLRPSSFTLPCLQAGVSWRQDSASSPHQVKHTALQKVLDVEGAFQGTSEVNSRQQASACASGTHSKSQGMLPGLQRTC